MTEALAELDDLIATEGARLNDVGRDYEEASNAFARYNEAQKSTDDEEVYNIRLRLHRLLQRTLVGMRMITACIYESDEVDGKPVFHSRWSARFPDEKIERMWLQKRSKRLWALQMALDLSETVSNDQPLLLAELPVIDWPALSPQAPVEIWQGGDVLLGLPRGATEDGDEWRAAKGLSRDQAPYTTVVTAIDPSLGSAKGDAVGVGIVGVTAGGRAIIRVAVGVRGQNRREVMETCAALITRYRANRLLVEKTGVGAYFGGQLEGFLAARGHPLRAEELKSGGVNKGQRIISALSPALASGKLFICREVLEAEDGPEFVSQYTQVREVIRKKTMSWDILDAVAYAVSDIAPILANDEAEYVTGARYDYEQLSTMDLRRRVLTLEEIEMFMEEDENESLLQSKLQNALAAQTRDIERGDEHAAQRLQPFIDSLTSDLASIRAVRRRIVAPTTRPINPRPADRRAYDRADIGRL